MTAVENFIALANHDFLLTPPPGLTALFTVDSTVHAVVVFDPLTARLKPQDVRRHRHVSGVVYVRRVPLGHMMPRPEEHPALSWRWFKGHSNWVDSVVPAQDSDSKQGKYNPLQHVTTKDTL